MSYKEPAFLMLPARDPITLTGPITYQPPATVPEVPADVTKDTVDAAIKYLLRPYTPTPDEQPPTL